MLYIVILEVLLVAGMAIAAFKDEKEQSAAYRKWVGGKKRTPIVREQIKAVKKGPKHRYVH